MRTGATSTPVRRRRWRRGGSAVIAFVMSVLLVSSIDPGAVARSDGQLSLDLGSGTRPQPASLMYGDTSGASAYAARGGLVVAGRDNYDDPAFHQVSEAGGSVLLYLDPVIDNDHGRYHDLLFNASECGPAAASWPGNPRANDWGGLADFRQGSVVQAKLRCVLETMVAENPHMAGWFADDVGSRSWFPRIDWESWDTASQQAYRDGAIALTKTFREVADAHGLVFIVNGTWGAGGLNRHGGGYPDPDQHGNALADGGFVENHDGRLPYFSRYACSPQWASMSGTRKDRPINYAVTATVAGLREFAGSDCFSYVNLQPSYTFAAPWAGAHDLGLPFRVRP